MFEWLKTILGEHYTEEVDKQVAAEIGKAFVAKEDFNTVNQAKKKLEKDVMTRDGQLEELRKADPEQLQSEIERLQSENKAAQENYQKDLIRLQKEAAVKIGLIGKAHDPSDVLDLLDLEQVELNDNGEIKTKLDDLVKPIRERKPYLFSDGSNVTGAKPADTGGRTTTEKPLEKMTYSELCEYADSHPDAQL